jgi:SH2 domain
MPFSSTLSFEPWFEGDISGSETTEWLSGQPPGTFLVRFSSQVGSYAVSFVTLDGEISHSLIEHEGVDGGQFRIWNDGQALLFPTLTEVVAYYGEALLYPYKFTASPLVAQASKHILEWKDQRLAQITVINATVDQLFDVIQLTPNTTYNDPVFAPPAPVRRGTVSESSASEDQFSRQHATAAKVEDLLDRLFDEY